jgi:hypothetical protein
MKNILKVSKSYTIYQIGSKIRCVGATDGHGFGGASVGDIGRIREIVYYRRAYSCPCCNLGQTPTLLIDFPEHDGWYGHDCDVEPINCNLDMIKHWEKERNEYNYFENTTVLSFLKPGPLANLGYYDSEFYYSFPIRELFLKDYEKIMITKECKDNDKISTTL